MIKRRYRATTSNGQVVFGNLNIMADGYFILEDNTYYGVMDEPDYHTQGMGCGLEDRGINDRYDAMEHGWVKGVERTMELIPPMYEVLPDTVDEYIGFDDKDGNGIYVNDEVIFAGWDKGFENTNMYTEMKKHAIDRLVIKIIPTPNNSLGFQYKIYFNKNGKNLTEKEYYDYSEEEYDKLPDHEKKTMERDWYYRGEELSFFGYLAKQNCFTIKKD